ncbi:DMSO/selenate family reductase complex B subunit [uncultured Tessaracoccus sp.]|uniref:DMSO/selenate family reductase complex B subunit n=1 Tax=uncultured Tessaracoccus sp. TaxID=905023 RepID=UPI0025DAA9CA|nr:DMSO/selenate family reductase complex B subunit [uncultured Tessaracoccus sp.]
MARFKQLAFTFDQSLCTGCKACQIACKDKHDLPVGVTWRRVAEYSGGGWQEHEAEGSWGQDVWTYYTSISCNHCADAICMEVCPSTAMRRGENGVVYVDPEVCIGCRYCEMACPYGAPQPDPDRGIMTKCDFCRDRIAAGEDPACVAACPTRALGYGEYDEVKAKGEGAGFEPLPDPSTTRPNLVVIPHPKAQKSGTGTGAVGNPAEL